MKVLFVSSGNSGEVKVLVRNQGLSLSDNGVNVSYFKIKGRRISGYLKNIHHLRNQVRTEKYEIFHAHYSFSGFLASFSGCRPLVVSLMGSDVYGNRLIRSIIRFFYNHFWDSTIVKTQRMKEVLDLPESYVIPNGVNLLQFSQISKLTARRYINHPENKKLILFGSDPSRPEKNYILARKSIAVLQRADTELVPLIDIPNEKIPYYLNAADLLLLTSNYEGSVNIVKEGMACDLPVVSTRVGDVEWLFGDEPGHFIAEHNPDDVADKIKQAIEFSEKHGRTSGRHRIIKLGLDSDTVAKKIITVYKEVLEKKS